MEAFKIEIFKKERPSEPLFFKTLNREDSHWVLSNILKLAEKEGKLIGTEQLYSYLYGYLKNEVLYRDQNVRACLENALKKCQIPLDALCFVFWDCESSVDLFILKDLITYWEFVWYETSDEAVVLFFPATEKLMLITEHGLMKTN